MKRVLLTTTAAIACIMLAPPVEARPASRHAGTSADFEASHGAGDRLIAVAQATPAENDEEDDEEEEEDEDVEEEEESDDLDQGDVEDDESTTVDPDSGPTTDDEDDIAVDGDDEEEEEGDEDEEDESFPSIPGTLNATISGTATLQAGVMGDRTSGIQFSNETDIELNVRGKADNGLLYGLKVLFQTETGFESTGETTFDEAYVYLGGPWGQGGRRQLS